MGKEWLLELWRLLAPSPSWKPRKRCCHIRWKGAVKVDRPARRWCDQWKVDELIRRRTGRTGWTQTYCWHIQCLINHSAVAKWVSLLVWLTVFIHYWTDKMHQICCYWGPVSVCPVTLIHCCGCFLGAVLCQHKMWLLSMKDGGFRWLCVCLYNTGCGHFVAQSLWIPSR